MELYIMDWFLNSKLIFFIIRDLLKINIIIVVHLILNPFYPVGKFKKIIFTL